MPIDEFNRGDNAGSAYFHVNQRRGRRWSMADAFLHPVAHRPNLTVYTQTQAVRLLMDDQVDEGSASRCLDHRSAPRTGVRLLKDGRIVDVRARREVILSAGAVGSPHLMQVSGLGPAGLPTEHQVSVDVDLPGWAKTSRTTCRFERSTACRVPGPSTRCTGIGSPAAAWDFGTSRCDRDP